MRWRIALALGLSFGYALAAGNGRLYRNDSFRVRSFEPPTSWQLSPQLSYPRLLAEYTHPDGGRLTLTAQKIAAGTTAETLARGAQPGLEKQGFSEIKIAPEPGSDEGVAARARLDARLDGGRRFLKQTYIVDGSLGYVVSLVASSVNQPQMARDFEWSVRSLNIGAEPSKLDADGGVPR